MSKYSEAEKQAILEQARATLEQGIEPNNPEPASESQLEAWKRRQEEQDAAREKHKRESEIAAIERRIQGQLQVLLTDSFKGIVAAEHDYLMNELLPELFCELRGAISDSIKIEIENNYKTAIAELRTDVAALKKRLDTEVIEHPALRAARAN
jgi:hypothetical protein